MSDGSFFDKLDSKQSFYFGIGGGLLVLFTLGFFVMLGIMLSGGSIGSSSGTQADGGSQPTPTRPSQPSKPRPSRPSAGGGNVDIANVSKQGEPAIGEKDAPVTMAYWYDYQCPFCKRFETRTLSKLVNDYVKKGKLRIIFKNFAFLGQDSNTAAIVSEAVWRTNPDKWFEWHKKMYEKQDGENSGWGSKEDILKMTETISGINVSEVKQVLNSKKSQLQQEAKQDKSEGRKFGVRGTPGFVLEQKSISGAQPYRVFKSTIDSNLN
ncbi:MAG: DsbA family protein [Candidatus Magasanikbacteria bacterium]